MLKKKQTFDKNATLLRYKSPSEARDTKGILQHNKGNLFQVHRQQLKWRETQSNFTKFREKDKDSLSIPNQYST